MKDSFYKPHSLKSGDGFDFNPGQEAISVALEELHQSEDEIKTNLRGINNPTLMIPRCLFKGDVVNAIDKVELERVYDKDGNRVPVDAQNHLPPTDILQADYLGARFSLDSNSFPIPVKPMVANEHWREGFIDEPKEFDFINNHISFYFDAAVNFNNEAYYICKGMNDMDYFDDMVHHKVTFKDGSTFYPSFRIEHGLIRRLIKDKVFVITKASIQNFEREYLGVNHELDAIEKPPYLDRKHEYYARELDIAIEAYTAIFSNNKGNKNNSNSARVKVWLKNKYPGESAAFYERIATVVLPKKNK